MKPSTLFVVVAIVSWCSIHQLQADDKTVDKQLELVLRDVHDRGATLHNAGDSAGCYRMYQGGLLVARQMIGHRPELQKTISQRLQQIDRDPSLANRALALHELIETVRGELSKPIKPPGPERIPFPPREVKEEPKPTAKVGEVIDGVVGRVLWQNQPLEDVEVLFLSRGTTSPRIYETVSGKQGVYSIPKLPAGKYLITLRPSPKCTVKVLPERYSTTSTTPLNIELKGNGEKFDLLLQ